MDATFGFHPPAPAPLARPLGPVALLRTLARNPLECWTRAHFEEPLVIGGFPFARVAVVSDPAIIRQILAERPSDYKKGALERRVLSSAGLGDGLVAVEGEPWQRQRRTLAPLLGRKMVASLAPVMADAASAVFDSWQISSQATRGQALDIKAEMSSLSLEVLVRCMFSKEFGDNLDAWRVALTQFFAASLRVDPFDILGLPDMLPRITRWRVRRMLRSFDEGVEEAITARRSRFSGHMNDAGHDMLALMLEAVDPDTRVRMSDAEVKANMLAFFFAGQETTSTVLTWTLYLLSQSPEWYQRVTAEAQAALQSPAEKAVERLVETRAVVEEAMRLYPPVVGITRSAVAGTRLGTHTLEHRTMLIVSPYVVHRHRLLWTDPDAFDPRRFLTATVNRHAYLPFGIGPRMCLGAAFALQEATLAVAILLNRFSIRLAPGQVVWPVHRFTLRPRDPLMMVVKPADNGGVKPVHMTDDRP
jgi:cytochrome P450